MNVLKAEGNRVVVLVALVFLGFAVAGCSTNSKDKKISQGEAIGIAFDRIAKDCATSDVIEVSATRKGNGWSILITDLPAIYPGEHTLILLDEFGKIIKVAPGL